MLARCSLAALLLTAAHVGALSTPFVLRSRRTTSTRARPAVAAVPLPSPPSIDGLAERPTTLTLPDIPKSKIRKGDYVVHRSFGVGKFLGLYEVSTIITLADGSRRKMRILKVRFKDGVLEVAMTDAKKDLKLFKRQEAVGEYGLVRLDGMRSRKTWEKRKAKAARKVWAVAEDLVRMYAERQNLTRAPCPADGEAMETFNAKFAYEPTPDQLECFDAVMRDMVHSTQPMDRLVCGDVGFGKTEIAMRAIYRMVLTGRQVGLLAPTTVLAAQHLRVLRARMPDLRVELLSSLAKRKPAELTALREHIASGDVDVIVGTHALLSPKVTFADLGLLVVDEEQRFGVRQKEKIKVAAATVDVLSLSATPIPRTMYMCMAGIRAMSSLHTAPVGRLPVQTRVLERDDGEMRGAIEAELARGGQVFYVVPRIEMVSTETELLEAAFPGARISFAFGGLPDLEKRIVAFSLGEIDVLVATTIMENGIDIPNVNTIVVQQTHMYGLAQLHQLRGRVGRAAVQAHALLFHPPTYALNEEAVQRLRVLQRETALGAGRSLAQADLEMRGAGNLFGEAQKGSSGMADIGLDMYVEVLQKAMVYLERKQALGLPDDPELEEELLREAMGDELLIGLEDSMTIKH